ncbi:MULTISPECIES: sporulation protein YqfD [Bacillus]|uniref:Stage IV sporulation protein n=2 Tax=Bacillus TaxID=1386 RepID=A0A0M4FJK0_9BACI|nr:MULTISPECIES: sporulation protein YqfD [Bacillus]ALC81667.1 stage IV sporulation protein [Bacillus gobiensis]MBP1080716.1 hypothetical protein [Bacillus capparidis]MED1094572.1 sporulation protein YqfD [Bacillus capparidis]
MKNKWFSFFSGTVQVEVKGPGIERFINECMRKKIPLYQVRRKNGHVLFFIRLSDVYALRRAIRNFECKCSFTKRKGLPFLIRKSMRNSGFAIGFFGFFLILFLLSNMVWSIHITGAKPETEHEIRKQLNEIGIKIGRLQFVTPTPEIIQKELTDRVSNITWIGVELNGTDLQMKVVEKNEPEKPEYVSPQDLVAKKKAVITNMFVEKGVPLVTVNEHVRKGQKLVSGIIGYEDNKQKVAAKGEILGETWYKSTVTVPLETTFQVYTGKVKTMHKLAAGSQSIPFWGFSLSDEEMGASKTEKLTYPLHFLQFKLPLSYEKELIRETETSKRSYTEKQAIEEGIKMGKKDVEKKIGIDGKVIDEKVLHQTSENGKVKLIILYQVIENIVKTTPIVQGD